MDDSNNPTDLLFGLDVTHSGRVPPAPDNGGGAPAQAAQSLLTPPAGSPAELPSPTAASTPFITVYGVKASTLPPVAGVASLLRQDRGRQFRRTKPNSRPISRSTLGGGNVNQILQLTAARLVATAPAAPAAPGKAPAATVTTAAGRFSSIFDWAVSVNASPPPNSLLGIVHYVKSQPPPPERLCIQRAGSGAPRSSRKQHAARTPSLR